MKPVPEIVLSLAHKIRTPLSVISNEISFLKRLNPSEELNRVETRCAQIVEILKGACNPDCCPVTEQTNFPIVTKAPVAHRDCILIVDDDLGAARSLANQLALHLSVNFILSASADDALLQFNKLAPQAVVLDLCLVEQEGTESGFNLLSKLISSSKPSRIIVLTGHGGSANGIRALREGAANFLEKPANQGHLAELLRDAIEQTNLRREYLNQSSATTTDSLGKLIVGSSACTVELKQQLRYASQTNLPVLLFGETGTGKGLCARALHDLSQRSKGRFVQYQPMFASGELIHSDLFGHLKGSFTGAQESRKGVIAEAEGGTLFLDEIDEVLPETQVTLLSVLQNRLLRPLGSSKEQLVDFRLVAATNRPIDIALDSGKLRLDLYHRIARVLIRVPPLRERLSDLPELCTHILAKLCTREAVNIFSITEAALNRLAQHSWPGNIRELESVIESAAYRASFNARNTITLSDLGLGISTEPPSMDLATMVEMFKHRTVQDALLSSHNNQVKAAAKLGIDRSTLRRIVEKALAEPT